MLNYRLRIIDKKQWREYYELDGYQIYLEWLSKERIFCLLDIVEEIFVTCLSKDLLPRISSGSVWRFEWSEVSFNVSVTTSGNEGVVSTSADVCASLVFNSNWFEEVLVSVDSGESVIGVSFSSDLKFKLD